MPAAGVAQHLPGDCTIAGHRALAGTIGAAPTIAERPP